MGRNSLVLGNGGEHLGAVREFRHGGGEAVVGIVKLLLLALLGEKFSNGQTEEEYGNKNCNVQEGAGRDELHRVYMCIIFLFRCWGSCACLFGIEDAVYHRADDEGNEHEREEQAGGLVKDVGNHRGIH
ncbi:hypothetical protein ATCV1_Z483R [Acanthocystis turfacea chlorella virus 1]|uniref:Uncharacterized protein Z483R n=1 Tax=Chlorovirus heliozoae TaxID=322019 RepID=A7K993_9PHYC|nr:hypothetical protein ATCV1_Z483R [Acanthocystis turfacea chlorella virus 1]ABT16617.1 hypothetical protein ATCV1_Z483R [Acanthocystis turfacea chlorella virus 1]